MSKEIKDIGQGDLDSKNLKSAKNSTVSATKDIFSDLSSENISQITLQLVNELGDFLQNKKDDIVSIGNKSRCKIKENPFIAVAGALAAGVLLGFIFKK